MNPDERVKKPEPERTQPIRNWWTLFGPPGMSPPPSDPVSSGVEAGYRVVEEYLRQGQSVARTFWAPFLGSDPSPNGAQAQRLAALFRSFSEFAGLWMELMASAAPGGFAARGSAAPTGTAGPFSMATDAPASHTTTGTRAPETPQTGLTLEIESKHRTAVSLDLRPCSSGLPLRVLDLRAPEPDKPRLTDVHIEGSAAEERLTFRLRIPDEHPPGVYSGLVLDERTGLPRGTISVRLDSE